jgi:hypothetical protein
MTKELKDLYAQLESLTPHIRVIEDIQEQIQHIKATCDHQGATFVYRYFEDEEEYEVFYCNQCDSRVTEVAL